jgi:hypothetical protein
MSFYFTDGRACDIACRLIGLLNGSEFVFFFFVYGLVYGI